MRLPPMKYCILEGTNKDKQADSDLMERAQLSY